MQNDIRIVSSALAVCALGMIGVGAHADCGGTAQTMSCDAVRVTLLYIDANADAWLATSGNISAVPCTPSGSLIRVPSTSANFKVVYATLLAAHMAGRDVNVRLVPNLTTQCTVAYVTVP